MLENIFTFVDSAIKGAPILALAASFLWGMLSILLSPCHLSSIPLIVGYMSGRGEIPGKRAFAISSVFALGILITLGIIGGLTMALGYIFFSKIGIWGNVLVAILFFAVGLYLLGILPFPFLSGSNQPKTGKRGILPALFLGLFFGLALGPCSFAYMMPVLGVASAQASVNLIYAMMLVLLYAAGHCIVIVFAGTFYKIVERYMKWNEQSKMLTIVKKVCGVLLILAGIYLASDVARMFIRF
jgi:cytochrome c-type biogenesis protein